LESGAEYKKLPDLQGAKGPNLFPGTQVLEDPHHPQEDCFMHISGKVVH